MELCSNIHFWKDYKNRIYEILIYLMINFKHLASWSTQLKKTVVFVVYSKRADRTKYM